MTIQQERIASVTALIGAYRSNEGAPDLGDRLVDAYIAAGRGDEYDIASTIIDCIADIGYRTGKEGGDVAQVLRDGLSGAAASSLTSKVITALRSAYVPGKAGYDAETDFANLVRIAGNHVEAEIEEDASPSP